MALVTTIIDADSQVNLGNKLASYLRDNFPNLTVDYPNGTDNWTMKLTGTIFNSSQINSKTIPISSYSGNWTICASLDIDNKYCSILTLQTTSGMGTSSSSLGNTLADILFYAEDSDHIGKVCYVGTNAIDNGLSNPFYCSVSSGSSTGQPFVFNIRLTDTNMNNNAGIENVFDLLPAYLGNAIINKLYVCTHQTTPIGRVISDGVNTYKCIGTGMWYKLN